MAEEKIFDEELMNDAELDEVAAGNAAEIQDDANKLRQLGVLGDEKVNQYQIRNAFLKLPMSGIVGGSIAFGYYGLERSNEYYAPVRGNVQKVTREYFWEYIFKEMQTF